MLTRPKTRPQRLGVLHCKVRRAVVDTSHVCGALPGRRRGSRTCLRVVWGHAEGDGGVAERLQLVAVAGEGCGGVALLGVARRDPAQRHGALRDCPPRSHNAEQPPGDDVFDRVLVVDVAREPDVPCLHTLRGHCAVTSRATHHRMIDRDMCAWAGKPASGDVLESIQRGHATIVVICGNRHNTHAATFTLNR